MADITIPGSSELPEEELFESFYTEVKEIEKRDSVLTPKQQIDRLLRPGSTYFNLNPFEVLHIDPQTSLEDIKKQYRRLSFLVHPDKNQDDSERAQTAFDIVNRSYKILENPDTKQKCLDVIEEANARTEMMIQEKKKKLKKDGKDPKVDEDDPVKFKHAVYVMTMKLFADMERKKRDQENRDMEERKRKREDEIASEERSKMEKEWQKNFEEILRCRSLDSIWERSTSFRMCVRILQYWLGHLKLPKQSRLAVISRGYTNRLL